jgi:hypothetical protein
MSEIDVQIIPLSKTQQKCKNRIMEVYVWIGGKFGGMNNGVPQWFAKATYEAPTLACNHMCQCHVGFWHRQTHVKHQTCCSVEV